MSEKYPELVFVAGPQAGQTLELTKPMAVLGRGGAADVMLSEEFISRSHMRYELLNAGPTLENLSAKGTWINGKRFKSGKKVLLDTGDLIGAGDETQMLFVAAGDDPVQAIDQFGPGARGKDAFGRRHVPAEAADLEAEPEPDGADQAGASTKKTTDGFRKPSEMTPGERAEVERLARRRKLLIGVGVWWGLIAVGGVLFMIFVKKPPPGIQDETRMLTAKEIRRQLEMPLEEKMASESGVKEHIDKALRLKKDYGFDIWKLHEVVHAFKTALSYSGGLNFQEPKHQDIYFEYLDKLTEEFSKRYRHACLLERNKEWQKATAAFEELLALLPDKNDKNPVFKNVQDHLSRVKYYQQQQQSKRKGWFN